MARWEDDLRAVVEHRGAALVDHARTLVAPMDDGAPDPAVELTARALAAAFRRGRRATGEHGSVRIVTDDDLDALEVAVRREQSRLAPARPGRAPREAGPQPPPPDDGPSDALSACLPEVVAQVRAARRRGRRRAWSGAAAAGVVVALAASTAAARPWDRATPDPTPSATPYAGACGATLPASGSLLPVTTGDQDAWDRTITAEQTWQTQYTGDASALTSDDLATLRTFAPEVVLARDGRVAALGAYTGDQQYMNPDDGSVSAMPPWPGVGGLTATALDLGYQGGAKTAPVDVSVRFVACDGGDVAPGTYQAHLFGSAADGSAHVLSDAADVTVLSSLPDGYQPPWLEGTALACGEHVTDFLMRIIGRPFTELEQGSTTDRGGRASFAFSNRSAGARDVVLPREVAVAWVKGDTIVGVGVDERGVATTTVGPRKTVRLTTRPWDTEDYCSPTTDGQPSRLPAGTYRVFAYARFATAGGDGPDDWFIANPAASTVVVHRDGSVDTR